MPRGYLLRDRHDSDAVIVAAAVALAMVLGGGGLAWPTLEVALQMLLAGLFALWGWVIPAQRLRALPRGVWLVAGLLVVLPLVQLLPLPPLLWHALPGRQPELAALALVGQQGSWRPLSLTPYQTFASLLVMTASAALLVMTACLRLAGRTQVLATIVAVALLSLLVGAAQITGGTGNFFRFYDKTNDFLNGFQAYHNVEADILLIAITACAATARAFVAHSQRAARKRLIMGATGVIITLLTLGVVLTASRAGIGLLAIALTVALVIVRPPARLRWRPMAMIIGGALALCLVVVILLQDNAVIGRTVNRFNSIQDARPEIWHLALVVARDHLPWGTGMGSFVPVFMAAEHLDMVNVYYTNRAHQDYVELVIETGLPGMVWGGLILALLGVAARNAIRQEQGVSRGHIICAMSALCVIAMHSLLDYPLRFMSLSCLAAVAAGLLFLPGSSGPRSEWKEQP